MKIICLDDDPRELKNLKSHIDDQFEIVTCRDLEDVEALRFDRDVVGAFLDVHLGDDKEGGIKALRYLHQVFPKILIIMVSYSESEVDIVSAFDQGAFAYLSKPLSKRIVDQYLEHILINIGVDSTDLWIGSSDASKACLHQILQASKNDVPVLIQGPTGTGKELAATILFRYYTNNSQEQMMSLNCGSIPETLFEGIFFGSEKGAYTDAFEHRKGVVEQARDMGGFIFLDEVGSLSPQNQAKLLRFVESGEYQRIGDPKIHKIKLKIIAADHQDLEVLVKEGKFREDLFHRLCAIRIYIPGLEERREDIPELAKHFLQEISQGTKRMARPAIKYLTQIKYPGNIRQLKHMIASAFIGSRSPIIFEKDFPSLQAIPGMTNVGSQNLVLSEELCAPEAMLDTSQILPLSQVVKKFEQDYCGQVIRHLKDDKKAAAKVLGISLASLYGKIK